MCQQRDPSSKFDARYGHAYLIDALYPLSSDQTVLLAEAMEVHETKDIPVVDLLLDQDNARLGARQSSQQAAYLALAKEVNSQLVTIARDIVAHGTDPTALTAVVATDGGRYRVLEGNRRTLALKALETPSIVKGGLTPGEQKKLEALSVQYSDSPIDEVPCVVFDAEEEAYHWIVLRHTGAHGGAGLVNWDANQADRYRTRKGAGTRDIAGQVIDFLDRVDGPGESKGFITTLRRIINNSAAKEALGLVRVDDQLQSVYPSAEVVKGLRKMIGDLRSKQIKTKHVYEAEDIARYVKSFNESELPDPSKKLTQPVALGELTIPKTASSKSRPKANPRPKGPRTTLIPKSCKINAPSGRIRAIYNELLSASVDEFPNACSVTLRVFVELSIDHEIAKRPALTGKADPNTNLAKRLKEIASDMKAKGEIDDDLHKAVVRIADTRGVMAASTVTFNQFVHNKYVHPLPSELRTAWDELQPFMEKVLA
jgi:hypothetical protein